MQQIKSGILVFIFILFLSSTFFALPAFAGNPPDFAHSGLSPSGQAPADGQSTISITITLRDSSNNTLSGDTISLSDPNNNNAVFNPSSTTLNSSGQATFTVTSTNPETDNISVTDTSTNTTLDNLGQITFIAVGAPTPTPPCSDSAPGSTPQITSAVANSTSQITLTWTDSTDPVSYYLVAYGITSGQYIYGNPNVGGQGITSYTVSNLAKGTTYYFAVKAVNGCNPGSFSNEVSATTTGGVIAAPVVTSTNTSSDTNNVPPTDTPTLSPTIEPTTTPTPVQVPTAGISKTQMLVYILVFIVIVGGAGNFVYWKRQKNKKKFSEPKEEIEIDKFS